MKDYIFITSKQSHNRIKYILEAIDSNDTDLYWSDKYIWYVKHGYEYKNFKRIVKNTDSKHLKEFRNCFGKFENHSFCFNVCILRNECIKIEIET